MDGRQVFFDTMIDLAREDRDIIILVGDLGYSFKEKFERMFPKQIINVGAAEQNMIGLAAGLALGGKKPYCYSGAIFLLMRAYEQVRDQICYNNLNVKLIGTGANGFLGFTHNILNPENEEDLLKNLPNLERRYPNSKEVKKVVIDTYKIKKPIYIKL